MDNFEPSSHVHESIIDFLVKNPQIKFIICSSYIESRIYSEELDHLSYSKIFIKDLTRKQIRLYTEKRLRKESEKEEVLERIGKFCEQLQLPLSYWTISLLLLIYTKLSDNIIERNIFGILDMCVDEMIGKKKLLFAKNKLQFDQYKELCSKIAHFLLVQHRESTYSTDSVTIITFIENYKKENVRIDSDSNDIFTFLVETGILTEKYKKYTFRLNGIFEYFLAYFIKENSEFKENILNDDSIYLNFRNELEIYTGFNRKDESFLKEVFEKTKSVFDEINSSYREKAKLDILLKDSVSEAKDLAKIVKNIKASSPLSYESQDEIKDGVDPLSTESEVRIKEPIDYSIKNFETLEKYLHILARVYKNSDNITNSELSYSIFGSV